MGYSDLGTLLGPELGGPGSKDSFLPSPLSEGPGSEEGSGSEGPGNGDVNCAGKHASVAGSSGDEEWRQSTTASHPRCREWNSEDLWQRIETTDEQPRNAYHADWCAEDFKGYLESQSDYESVLSVEFRPERPSRSRRRAPESDLLPVRYKRLPRTLGKSAVSPMAAEAPATVS